MRERHTHHAGSAFIENCIEEREERGEKGGTWPPGEKERENEGGAGRAPHFKGRSARHVHRDHTAG